MKKILIVEDEEKLRFIVKEYLQNEGFKVFESEDSTEVNNILYSEKPDLIILDLMLPKKSGLELCSEIKEISNVPILILTAKTTENDEIESFKMGADDFLRKPFSLKVLVMRINRLLKLSPEGIKKVKNLEINEKKHFVAVEGNEVKLSPKEYDLLLYFIRHKNIVLERDKILNEIWDYNYFGDYRTVDTHIKSLRKKVGSEFIVTVRGTGYMLRED